MFFIWALRPDREQLRRLGHEPRGEGSAGVVPRLARVVTLLPASRAWAGVATARSVSAAPAVMPVRTAATTDVGQGRSGPRSCGRPPSASGKERARVTDGRPPRTHGR
jgi:hypothetical protein